MKLATENKQTAPIVISYEFANCYQKLSKHRGEKLESPQKLRMIHY